MSHVDKTPTPRQKIADQRRDTIERLDRNVPGRTAEDVAASLNEHMTEEFGNTSAQTVRKDRIIIAARRKARSVIGQLRALALRDY